MRSTRAEIERWLLGAALGPGILAFAATPVWAAERFCSTTASTLFEACRFELRDDFLVAKAKCLNLADMEERKECTTSAKEDRAESRENCQATLDWRHDACAVLGESRYDPDFDPKDFDDDFDDLTNPNPYFPLAIGNHWEFQGAGEVNTLDVLDQTKRIDGVTCIVVRDLVTKDGDQVELTDDWFAQALDGNVWYCGEEVKDFESFAGDMPRLPELVSIDGSFKAGRDLDKPGIIFLASPSAGQAYIEEFSLGNAEDVTEVLSTTYAWGDDIDLDRSVPEALAEQLCEDDCVVTKNYSLLEPGVTARKYYARDIGFFLEVTPDGEVIQLTDCNFDPRCSTLPPP
jgi:hypothetical protein